MGKGSRQRTAGAEAGGRRKHQVRGEAQRANGVAGNEAGERGGQAMQEPAATAGNLILTLRMQEATGVF